MKSEKNKIEGKKYNNLRVLSLFEIRKRADSKRNRYYYLCECDCGNKIVVEKSKIISGHTKSCGCARKEFNEGQFQKKYDIDIKNEPLYDIWSSMKRRCSNKRYKNYFGRGIKVCEEWIKSFMSFYKWSLENGYKKGLSIDRIDNNGNYEPCNCRWATNKQQQRNKRNNHIIEVYGISGPVSEICEKYNVNRNIVFYRLRKNMDFLDLFGEK